MLLPDQPSPIGGGSFSPSSKNQRSSRRDRSQTAERTTKASKTSRLVNRFRRGGSSTGSSVHSTSSNEDLRHDAGMTSNPKHDRRHDHLSPLAHSILVEQQKAAAELSSRGNEEGNVSGTLSAAGTGSQVNLIHQARSVESTIRSPSTDSTTVTDQIAGQNRMHQSSSRLLRMTDDERPFTRDFQDLFSTLMVSLPMQVHRIKLRPIDHTFSSEEAINNLGSLKFSQSNRMPDPKDQGRIVTTTTTTTFSMAREMARSVCQKFIDARFIESADGKLHAQFTLKGGVWQVTPKGLNILGRFCQRNGIGQSHISTILSSDRNTMQLVLLERDPATDRLSYDRGTVEVIFRRFIGVDGPNIKTNTLVADSESVHEYSSGLVGVKLAAERRLADGIHRNTFTGRAAVDWLMDCCTTVDRRETLEIAASLVHHGLIYCLSDDKTFHPQSPMEREFQPSRLAVYGLTDRGKRVAGWTTSPREHLAGTSPKPIQPSVDRRDAIKLTQIITDPALRLQFKEFLRDIHCEENLLFFLDVKEFTDEFKGMTAAGKVPRVDVVRETLAQAYGLYNAFLAPGSPCELNIDSKLRNGLAGRMTRAVGDDHGMLQSLKQVAALFEEAQDHVFKLMATDSVPKFLKDEHYQHFAREFHNTEGTLPLDKTAFGAKLANFHT